MEVAMINDEIVPIETAQVSAHDRGLFFGDGVYEVVVYRGGRLFAWDRHLERFERSLREMQMIEKVDLGVVEERVRRGLEASKLGEAVVYFHVTRGSGLRSHDWQAGWEPNFLLTVRPNLHKHPSETTVISHPDWRWKRCDIKSLNLLANVLAKHAAIAAGAYEAVLVNGEGRVTEGTSTSVLMVKDGALRTAGLDANVLPGITRALLLQTAGEVGLEAVEASFSLAEAKEADELFLTGTTTEVMGITALDGETIGTGRLGPYSKKLRAVLVEMIESGT